MPCGFLIDMDGVIYRGGQVIPGAIDFIATLQERSIPFLFLTNNSQRTRLDVVTKLAQLGINGISERQVFTCAIATARFLRMQKPNPTAYVIGEGGLLSALNHFGIACADSNPDYVVVGEGRTVNFEMLEAATRHILNGARLIATNLDPSCPTQAGTRPGAGAIAAFLQSATGIQAMGLGKPSPIMLRLARKELGLRTNQIVMIGDTMETDILGGVQMGYQTVLVLSGGTKAEDLATSPYLPDLVIEHIGVLVDYLDERGIIRYVDQHADERRRKGTSARLMTSFQSF